MAKILNTDDVLEAVTKDNIPETEILVQTMVEALDMLAAKVAAHYGIEKGETTWEGKAFGGLCASFYPKTADQPCPEMIDDGDPGGDWEPRNTDENSEKQQEPTV